MVRKWMIVLVVFAFAASLMALSSCAKKQVSSEGAAAPTQQRVTPAPAPTPTPPPTPSMGMTEEQRQAKAFEAESIYFDFDKADLKPAARAVLDKKAAWLRANPQYKVRIEGNCDERGTGEYNLALGDRRAKSAMKYLNAQGIPNNRMTTVSFGEEKPVDPGHNEAAWSKNRRDDFKLTK